MSAFSLKTTKKKGSAMRAAVSKVQTLLVGGHCKEAHTQPMQLSCAGLSCKQDPRRRLRAILRRQRLCARWRATANCNLKGKLTHAVPCRPAPRAAVRLTSRAARSAWGDRDDSPVSREARRVAQQAYTEAQREVAFAKQQLARAEEEARPMRNKSPCLYCPWFPFQARRRVRWHSPSNSLRARKRRRILRATSSSPLF